MLVSFCGWERAFPGIRLKEVHVGGSWGVSGTDSNRLWSPVLGLVLLQMRLFDAGLI